MTKSISLHKNTGAYLCPHGVAQNACPICSKKNVSGGMQNTIAAKRNNGQWSYQKCYVVGLEIKSAILRRELAKNFFETRFQNSLTANKNIQNLINRFNQFIQNIKLPIIQLSVRFIINTVSSIFYNKNIEVFTKLSNNLLFHTGEKLVNILGELKNFIDRKLFNDLKIQAKKFMSLCLSVIEDENYKNDETLAIFESGEKKRYIKYEHRENK